MHEWRAQLHRDDNRRCSHGFRPRPGSLTAAQQANRLFVFLWFARARTCVLRWRDFMTFPICTYRNRSQPLLGLSARTSRIGTASRSARWIFRGRRRVLSGRCGCHTCLTAPNTHALRRLEFAPLSPIGCCILILIVLLTMTDVTFLHKHEDDGNGFCHSYACGFCGNITI